MTSEQLYEHLENLARQLGISIRYEDLSHPELKATSGLCKIKGKEYYIMDRSKPLEKRIALLADCLGQMNLEGVYMLPALRSFLKGGWANGQEA
jgi:hypothetical protein